VAARSHGAFVLQFFFGLLRSASCFAFGAAVASVVCVCVCVCDICVSCVVLLLSVCPALFSVLFWLGSGCFVLSPAPFFTPRHLLGIFLGLLCGARAARPRAPAWHTCACAACGDSLFFLRYF
jgi:hypothetical protein